MRVAASQYLIRYVLIDVLKRFRKQAPDIHVRISTMSELEVEEALRNDPEVALGVAAPYEPSPDLEYHELFAMSWSLITPPRHALMAKRRLQLQDLTDQALILVRARIDRPAARPRRLSRPRSLSACHTRDHEHRNHRQHGRGGTGYFDCSAPSERRRHAGTTCRGADARRPDSSNSLRRPGETERKALSGRRAPPRLHEVPLFSLIFYCLNAEARRRRDTHGENDEGSVAASVGLR